VPWRRWGNLNATRRALAELRPPENFVVSEDDVRDMRPLFARAHATIVCFGSGAGKACPNFVVEGLAMARPCISTVTTGIAHDLQRTHAGIVVSRDANALADAVDRVRAGWHGFATRARQLAEECFDICQFRQRYEHLYATLATSGSAAAQ
jgi:glycosyltransferase involved in cell wall biosynthesis